MPNIRSTYSILDMGIKMETGQSKQQKIPKETALVSNKLLAFGWKKEFQKKPIL